VVDQIGQQRLGLGSGLNSLGAVRECSDGVGILGIARALAETLQQVDDLVRVLFGLLASSWTADGLARPAEQGGKGIGGTVVGFRSIGVAERLGGRGARWRFGGNGEMRCHDRGSQKIDQSTLINASALPSRILHKNPWFVRWL